MFLITAFMTLMLLLLASAFDLRTREVPDWIACSIIGVAIFSCIAGWSGISLIVEAVGGCVGLLIGVLLFHFGKFGGGDAKLIAALGFLLGPVGLVIMLFWMSLSGGVLSLIAIGRGQRDFAYVPAIATGFIGYVAMVSIL